MTLRALSLWQPWASETYLVNPATGRPYKSIETRSYPTKYRGPLGIHAAKNVKPLAYLGWLEDHIGEAEETLIPVASMVTFGCGRGGTVTVADTSLPLGALVATCQLVDVVPIIARENNEPYERFVRHVLPEDWGEPDKGTLALCRESGEYDDVTDQQPYGDFTPGRYAWILEDAKPTTERCPACWGYGWIDETPADVQPRRQLERPCPLDCEGIDTTGCPPIPWRGRQQLFTIDFEKAA